MPNKLRWPDQAIREATNVMVDIRAAKLHQGRTIVFGTAYNGDAQRADPWWCRPFRATVRKCTGGMQCIYINLSPWGLSSMTCVKFSDIALASVFVGTTNSVLK
jgi:hypothetical protein